MRVVVHRVDAPRLAGAVVGRVADPVQHRVAHVHVLRLEVDLRAQHVRAFLELARAHAREQVQALCDGPLAVGAGLPLLVEVAAVLADLFLGQAVDVRLALLDQLHRELVQLLEVVRRVEQVRPLEAEPLDVFLDRLDVFDVFRGRVGVVEAQVARAAELLRETEVDADRLGVADVQVAVRLGREPGGDAATVSLAGHVRGDDFTDEVSGSSVGLFGLGLLALMSGCRSLLEVATGTRITGGTGLLDFDGMSIVESLTKLVDPMVARAREEERKAEREKPKRENAGDPPRFACRVCGHEDDRGRLLPDLPRRHDAADPSRQAGQVARRLVFELSPAARGTIDSWARSSLLPSASSRRARAAVDGWRHRGGLGPQRKRPLHPAPARPTKRRSRRVCCSRWSKAGRSTAR